MSEMRFFWVKCWALEMRGTANVAMARATESFAYFERHGMSVFPPEEVFSQRGSWNETSCWVGDMAHEHWAWASLRRSMLAGSGKVVRGDGGNVTKTSNRGQLLAGLVIGFCCGCKVLVILGPASAPQVRTGWMWCGGAAPLRKPD